MISSKQIAVYYGPGSSKEYVEKHWGKLIKDIRLLSNVEFTKETLNELDIVILPGGSGSKICEGLGTKGKRLLRDWVIGGGIIIGVCAGMFALLKGYEWSIGMLDYELVDKPYWIRGRHFVSLSITVSGKKFLKLRRDMLHNVPYHNGPVVKKTQIIDPNISNEKVLAIFETDLPAEGGQENTMKKTPAIVVCNYGMGTVIAFSPHLEADKNYKKIIRKLIRNV